jgi:hypothetical protein
LLEQSSTIARRRAREELLDRLLKKFLFGLARALGELVQGGALRVA